jgi:hypothetical protein
MTEDNRKDQDKREKKDELTEKDLDQASGGHIKPQHEHIYDGIKPEDGRPR